MKPSNILRIVIALALVSVAIATSFGQGTVMPAPKFTPLDNNGLIIAGGKLCTYAAGTTTPQATYSDSGLTVPNLNPVIMDASGRATIYLSPTSYKFVMLTAGTDNTCNTGSILWTQDNISATPSSTGITSQQGAAGETISAGHAAYLSDGSGGKTPGLWYNADTTNAYSSTLNTVGVTSATVATGATGTFILSGPATTLSGLSVGAAYYVGTAGAITTTQGTNIHLLGNAQSATTLVLSAPAVETSITPVNRGGTGVTTLAANAVVLGNGTAAVTTISPGAAGSALVSTGTAWTTSSVGMVLLHANSSTDTNGSATTVDSVAISGLTTADTIRVLYTLESVTQATANVILYSVTDSTSLVSLSAASQIASGSQEQGEALLRMRQGSSTLLFSLARGYIAGSTNVDAATIATLTTLWTSSWTLGLRHSGVTGGGTFKYNWAVYKMAGQ